MIAARTGIPGRLFLERRGESALRRMEAAVAAELLHGPPCILATGAGAWTVRQIRAQTAQRAFSIWLRGEPSLLLARIGKSDRSLLRTRDPVELFNEHVARREHLYALANATLDVTQEPVERTACRLEQVLLEAGILAPGRSTSVPSSAPRDPHASPPRQNVFARDDRPERNPIHNTSVNPGHDEMSRSAWSSLEGVAAVEIGPCERAVTGRVALPGSKSETNRALMMAACADGISELGAILKSEDSYWCVAALTHLGVAIGEHGDTIRVEGTGARWRRTKDPVFIGSAGTIARFLPGLLCAGDGEWMVRASLQLSSRPIKPLVDALIDLGGDIVFVQEWGRLPIRIKGRRLSGGTVHMSGAVSSQFVSGVIMASPLASNPVQIEVTDAIVQPGYVQVTLTMLKRFGVEVEADDSFRRFSIRPQPYRPASMNIAADASTASYFLALAAVTGGDVTITNLSSTSEQPDVQFLHVLERLGCEVAADDSGVRVRARGPLRGGQYFDMKALSDVALTLAAMAPFADGPIGIGGVEHIRHHECDRLSAMAASLSLLGIKVEERPDGLTIWPGRPACAELDTYDDHRVAMSLAVLGSAANGIVLRNPGCVSKTCPSFFDLLTKLGLTVRYR